jgi:hypothetical protein
MIIISVVVVHKLPNLESSFVSTYSTEITCHEKKPFDTLQNCGCLKLHLLQPSENKTKINQKNVLVIYLFLKTA